MKKLITTIVCVVIVMTISAQELTSKRGFPILPEQGDIAHVVCAGPFLDYAGNSYRNIFVYVLLSIYGKEVC